MSGALAVIGLPPPPSSRGGSMPRYSATMAISSARRRRWPFRRSVTAEGERPSAFARPLRVLPVCLRPARIQSTVNVPPLSCGHSRGCPRSRRLAAANSDGLTTFSEKRQLQKTENWPPFGFAEDGDGRSSFPAPVKKADGRGRRRGVRSGLHAGFSPSGNTIGLYARHLKQFEVHLSSIQHLLWNL